RREPPGSKPVRQSAPAIAARPDHHRRRIGGGQCSFSSFSADVLPFFRPPSLALGRLGQMCPAALSILPPVATVTAPAFMALRASRLQRCSAAMHAAVPARGLAGLDPSRLALAVSKSLHSECPGSCHG